MSKKDKKKLSVAQEFSLSSEPEKRENQDNGFFFENPETVTSAPDVTAKDEKDSFERIEPEKKEAPSDDFVKAEDKVHEKVEIKAEEKPEEKKAEAKAEVEEKKAEAKAEAEEKKSEKNKAEKKPKDNSAKKENAEKKEKDGNSTFAYFFKIAGVLTLICSFVALMLASVNMLTKDIIAQNAEKEKTAAVTQLFTEANDAFPYEEYKGEEEIYIATKDGSLYGYCVSVVSQGYGGEISMMVGIRYDGVVQGVKIISMSETAGLGSKTKNDSFLGQYADKKGPFTVGENVDGIAGATISSKAVTSGVNAALELGVTPESIAAEKGISLYGEEASLEPEVSETEKAPETTVGMGVPEIETAEREDTHIDPASVGQYQSKYYYENDKSYTANRENGHYLEKETTDTESETESDSDGTI